MARKFKRFTHKDANFHIYSRCAEAAEREIIRQRAVLEDYIRLHPEFGKSLSAVETQVGAREIAKRMAHAAAMAGVGPMAAVAGAVAQMAACAALAAGADEAVVENGGDLFCICRQKLVVGLYAGESPLGDKLAFVIEPESTPLAICSSSGKMGHSFSQGDCDLACVVARDASIADAAATRAANIVSSPQDIDSALAEITAIEGVGGALLVKDDRIGLAGKLPELVANRDAELPLKVTRAAKIPPTPRIVSP